MLLVLPPPAPITDKLHDSDFANCSLIDFRMQLTPIIKDLTHPKEFEGEESQIGAGLLGRVVLSSIRWGRRVATARRTQQALLLGKQL